MPVHAASMTPQIFSLYDLPDLDTVLPEETDIIEAVPPVSGEGGIERVEGKDLRRRMRRMTTAARRKFGGSWR